MPDIDFSIIVVTYNRNEQLQECLKGFKMQTYKNFELFVIDRGSNPSAEGVVLAFSDERFLYKKSSQENHFCDVINEAIKDLKGKYICVFGDDDILCKQSLEIVKNTFEKNKDTDIVVLGSCTLDKNNFEKILIPSHFSSDKNFPYFQKDLPFLKFKGKDWIKYILSAQFIGPKIKCNYPSYLHPSTFFIRKGEVFDRVIKKQGGIAVKPSFDSGYIGLAYYTKMIYLNAPLAIITFGVSNVSISKRRHWNKETEDIKYMPKISQLENRGADSLLNVLHKNGIEGEFNIKIQLKLYRIILRSVLCDDIWDFQTLKDCFILLPFYFRDSKIKIDVLFEYARIILTGLKKHIFGKKKQCVNKHTKSFLTAEKVRDAIEVIYESQFEAVKNVLKI